MDLKRLVGTQPLGICVISLSELAQGQAQARGSRRAQLRASFVRELQETFPMYEISEQIAIRGGLLSGTLQSNGLTIGLADVLIAATALEIGFGVLTHNVKHFAYVSGLRVTAALP